VFFKLWVITYHWLARNSVFFFAPSICFILLKFSKFSTKDKVAIHVEAKSGSILAGKFPKPPRLGGQMPLSDSSRHAATYSDTCRFLCKSETDVQSALYV